MNEHYTFVFLPLICSGTVYWGLSFCWFMLDVFVAPKWRVSGGEYIDWNLYGKTAKHVLKLHAMTPIVLYGMIPLWKYRGVDVGWNTFFSSLTVLKCCACPILGQIVFYIGHRVGHLPCFYKTIHKKHHEWVVPCAVAASYASFYEYLFCNLPVFLLPPLIVNLNWNAAQLWFMFATMNVVNDHSGYILFDRSVYHAIHHKHQKYNYSFPELDAFLRNVDFLSVMQKSKK